MIWFTSDTHFGHSNIIGYCQREYSDVVEMNEDIIRKWNSKIQEGDTVYHLGDFGFGNSHFIKTCYDRLKGKKILLKGNHDKKNLKILPFLSDSILVVHYDRYLLVLCHYPMLSWPHMAYGSIHLHGHTHRETPTDTKLNRFNVCVENNRFYPVSIEEILAQYNK